MKKVFSLVVLLSASLFLLSGCRSNPEPLEKRVDKVIDLGALPLPNSALKLHGYQVINSTSHDHFVYLVERDGQPVVGTSVNQNISSGKSSHNQLVTSVLVDAPASQEAPARTATAGVADAAPVAPTSIRVECGTPERCMRMAEAIRNVQ